MPTIRSFSKAINSLSYRFRDALESRCGRDPYFSSLQEEAWECAVDRLMFGSKARVYGIELEVLTDDSRSFRGVDNAALDAFKACRVSDGSLDSGGLEFKFPPLRADYIKRARVIDHTERALGDVALQLQPWQLDTYGIHIHSNTGWMHSTTPYIVSCFVRSNPTFFRWVSGRYGYSPYWDSHCNFTGKMATCWQPGLGTLEWRIFRSTYNQRLVNVWLDIVQAVEDWAESVANSGAVSYVPTLARPLQCSEGTSIHGYDGLQAFFAFVNQSRRRYGTVKRAIKKYITLDVCAIQELVDLDYDEDDEDEEATCHYKRMSAVMEDSLPYIYPEPKCRKVPSHA